MQLVNFLDDIFTNHPVFSVAFSGFGITIISILIYLIRKTLKSFKCSNPKTLTSESETIITIPPLTEPTLSFPQIESDIKVIEQSIKFDLSYNQKNIFLRYFNKYKNNFKRIDVDSLNKQLTLFSPDYSSLLSQLLGLIETLVKK